MQGIESPSAGRAGGPADANAKAVFDRSTTTFTFNPANNDYVWRVINEDGTQGQLDSAPITIQDVR